METCCYSYACEKPSPNAGEKNSKKSKLIIIVKEIKIIITELKTQKKKLWKRTKNAMEHESDGDTNPKWSTRNDPQRLDKEAGRVGNRWMN